MNKQKVLRGFWGGALALLALLVWGASAAELPQSLNWRTNQNRVSADIKGGDLLKTLGKISSATGWRVYVEPGSAHTVSTKFKDRPQSEALRLLLGDLSFAVIPETNEASKL